MVWGSAARARAGESLAALVPDDAGLYIEVDDLATHSRRFMASNLFNRIQEFGPIQGIIEDSKGRLTEVGHEMGRQLQLAPDDLVDGLFGARAAFGVWPQTFAESDVRSGLLLFEVEDRALLLRALNGTSEAQRKAGAIVAESRTKHNGETYEVRIFGRPNVETKVYFAALGNIGVITGSDGVMQRVLELKSSAADVPNGSLAATSAYREGMARLKADAALKLFVNPRPWDELMRVQLVGNDDAETQFVKRGLVEAWLVADYWVTSGNFGSGIEIESYFRVEPDKLPETMREVSAGLTGEADFLDRVPQDAIFAFAGRMDIGRLARMFLEAGDEASQQQLNEMRDFGRGLLMGLDLFDDVLTSLGPDLGMFLLPTDDEESAGVRLAVGARMQSRAEGDARPEVSEALDGGARNIMAVASTFFNNRQRAGREPARINVTEVGETKVTSLTNFNLLPANVEISYALFDDYFLFGTSPEALRQTIELQPSDSLSNSPRLQNLVDATLGEPSQILYIDCAPFREFMREHGDLFSTAVVMSRGLDRDLARQAIEQIEQWLELADTIVVASKVDEQGLSLSVGISTAQDEAAALTLQPSR